MIKHSPPIIRHGDWPDLIFVTGLREKLGGQGEEKVGSAKNLLF